LHCISPTITQSGEIVVDVVVVEELVVDVDVEEDVVVVKLLYKSINSHIFSSIFCKDAESVSHVAIDVQAKAGPL
jgi:hypothetical protein